MKRFLLTAMLTIMAVRAGWEVHWEANPFNVSLQLVTKCKGKEPFYAVDSVPIEGEWNTVTTRRQITPKGTRCTVVASVMRNNDGGAGNPDNDYVAESAIVIEEQ